jgi:pimeloyl-ACP methyl ester carboxylesterase
MAEVPVKFGRESSLLGVVSEPIGGARPVCCILITAGLTLRSGPFRLYTTLARKLAQAGILALRFDLDSIGDSGSCYSDLTLDERTPLEIKAAVNFMSQQYGVEQFIMCGLCSGAEAGLRYAQADRRVMGVVMYDPFAHPAPGHRWRVQRHRLYRRALRFLGLYKPINYAGGPGLDGGLVQYQYMDYHESQKILMDLVERQVYLHFVYTGAVQEVFNHPKQLAKVFPCLDSNQRTQVDVLADVSHTPVFASQVEKMTEVVLAKLVRDLNKQENLEPEAPAVGVARAAAGVYRS